MEQLQSHSANSFNKQRNINAQFHTVMEGILNSCILNAFMVMYEGAHTVV